VAPRDTDIVQPKVRLRKALHRRLTDAARANKATLNGEIVRRLQESFVHEALNDRLRISETVESLEKRMDQIRTAMEQIQALFEGSFASNVKINSSAAAVGFDMAPRRQSEVAAKPRGRTKGRERDARAFAEARSGVLGNKDRGRTP
jgi:hypothetical protein